MDMDNKKNNINLDDIELDFNFNNNNYIDDTDDDIINNIFEKYDIYGYIADDEKYQIKTNEYEKGENIRKAIKCYHKEKEKDFLIDFFNITKEYKNINNKTISENKNKEMHLSIEPSLYNAIKDISNITNISINEIIRLAIIKSIISYSKNTKKLKSKK